MITEYGDWTCSETKFVRKDEEDDSPVFSRSSVPPTICLTFPSCRSIHGRNWDRLRGDSVVGVDMESSVGDRW